MKKLISLICCVAVIFSLTATVSFAETTNLSVSVVDDDSIINVGDTVTVTLKNAAMVATSVTGGFYFDTDLLTCDSITDARGRNPGVGYLQDDFEDWYKATAFTDVDTANSKGTIGIALAGTSDVNFVALDIATVVFTAKKAGTVTFSIYESTSGTDKVNVDGVNPVTLTIQEAGPVVDETIDVSAATSDETAKTETYAVTVGSDLVGDNKVKAVLTNTAAEAGNQTQEVALKFSGFEGEVQAVFNIVVKFIDYANAATTTLAIEKVQ